MKAIGRHSVSSALAAMIDVGWYGTLIGIAMFLLLALLPLVWDVRSGTNVSMDIPASFSLDLHDVSIAAPSLGVAHASVEQARGEGLLTFPPPSGVFLAAVALSVAVVLAWASWILAQLRAVFRTLRDGRPFVSANAARIRRIGYAVIAGEILRVAFALTGNVYVAQHFVADRLQFHVWPHLDFSALVAGLIILVIAEVFRAGARLEEEQSLIV
jgi:hypothetical protein